MSHEKGSAGGTYALNDCGDVALVSGAKVLSLTDISTLALDINADSIIVADADNCPTILSVPPCDGISNNSRLTMVLGARDNTTVPIWGKPDRPPVQLLEVHDTDAFNAESADLMWYRDVGVATVTLDPPVSGCVRNDLWVKNGSASSLTITPSFGLIDGAASLVLTTFQKAHLVWNNQINEWYTI